MRWILPPVARQSRPAFPAWWMWVLLPLVCVSVAGVILLFTWPLERGFASLRFWFWLLAAPLLVAGALGLFWLSHLLHQRREIDFRHLFLDRQQAQWRTQGHSALKLAAWHLVTPEPELMERITGISGVPPEAPPVTLRLPVEEGSMLGESPLRQLFTALLGPLQPALSALPVVDIWLSAAGQPEEDCRQALMQAWLRQQGRQLSASRLNWLSQPAGAELLETWCDEPADIPRLLLCLHQITDDSKAAEFSAALLFIPHNQRLPEQLPFRPVWLFRPLLTSASAPEKNLTHGWTCSNCHRATADIYGMPGLIPAPAIRCSPCWISLGIRCQPKVSICCPLWWAIRAAPVLCWRSRWPQRPPTPASRASWW
ncbi:hypothetical protein [Type-D symbiont of Plautia stali]|uniref:hypothetical protein n=1 Tax=Type-D symbiont of Plautia stali TaxID=1560356 RepID=UPI00073F7ACC|nr:hypothetical protein [Type-D symbiont of Plautia stali]